MRQVSIELQWGFDFWLGHQAEAWKAAKSAAIEQSHVGLTQLKAKVFGVDLDSRVLKTAQQNAKNAGVQRFIEFSCKNANDMKNALDLKGRFYLTHLTVNE